MYPILSMSTTRFSSALKERGGPLNSGVIFSLIWSESIVMLYFCTAALSGGDVSQIEGDMEDGADGSLVPVWVLLNTHICKWAVAPGPAFVSVSSVLKLVISGVCMHRHTLTHTLTHIDESCSQANWNLDMDYSCLVDEPGESPNYEFQTCWPTCMVYDIMMFWLVMRWKLLITVSVYPGWRCAHLNTQIWTLLQRKIIKNCTCYTFWPNTLWMRYTCKNIWSWKNMNNHVSIQLKKPNKCIFIFAIYYAMTFFCKELFCLSKHVEDQMMVDALAACLHISHVKYSRWQMTIQS